MSITAYGAEKVKVLERALGGKPPTQSGKQARMRLDRFVNDRFKTLRAERQESARLAAPIRDHLFNHISKDDSSVRHSIEKMRRFLERRPKPKIPQPRVKRMVPRFTSGVWFKVPPYDDGFVFTTGNPGSFVSDDKDAGNYFLAPVSGGSNDVGLAEVAAGIAVWFYCMTEDPMQRVAALLDYSDAWGDSPLGASATNDLRTRIWVWGPTEQKWVVQSDLQPSHGDAVGGFGGHGNYPPGDSGRISIETCFPAQANQWYEAWIWSDAWVYTDSGIFGSAFSWIVFSAAVPLVTFGSLF